MSFFTFSRRAVRVAVLLGVLVAALAVPSPALAQDTAENSTDGAASDTVVISVDPAVDVVSYDWSGNEVTVVLRSNLTRQVVITDASQRLRGAVDIRRERFTVPRGSNVERTFRVENGDRPAVTIGTRYGLVGIGAEEKREAIIGGPWTVTDARLAGIGSALAVSLGAVVAAYRRRSGQTAEIEREV